LASKSKLGRSVLENKNNGSVITVAHIAITIYLAVASYLLVRFYFSCFVLLSAYFLFQFCVSRRGVAMHFDWPTDKALIL